MFVKALRVLYNEENTNNGPRIGGYQMIKILEMAICNESGMLVVWIFQELID